MPYIEFYLVYYLCRKRPKSITAIPIYLPIDVYNAPLYVCVKCVRPFGSWSDRLLAPHDNGHSILFIPHIQSINMGKNKKGTPAQHQQAGMMHIELI